LVIKTLDPDSQLEKLLDPDPHEINADPKPFLPHPLKQAPR
jgi:hypothetical protein